MNDFFEYENKEASVQEAFVVGLNTFLHSFVDDVLVPKLARQLKRVRIPERKKKSQMSIDELF